MKKVKLDTGKLNLRKDRIANLTQENMVNLNGGTFGTIPVLTGLGTIMLPVSKDLTKGYNNSFVNYTSPEAGCPIATCGCNPTITYNNCPHNTDLSKPGHC